MALPRRWATNTNFSTGVDTGTPTRVDPGAGYAANGFLPHDGLAAQHMNHLLGEMIDALYEPLETPEAYAEIRDDFMSPWFDSANDILHSAERWEITSTEDAGVGDGFDHPGQVLASLSTGQEFGMRLLGLHRPVPWGQLQEMTIVAG